MLSLDYYQMQYPNNVRKYEPTTHQADSTKSYLRKEQYKISRIVTNDLNKNAAMETIEKRIENKTRFPTLFWQDTR